MSVLDPDELSASPLADLHALASELGLDGYRRLRKQELIEALLAHQGAEGGAEPADGGAEPAEGGAEPADGAPAEGGAEAEGAEPAAAAPDEVTPDADADDEAAAEPAPGARERAPARPRGRRARGRRGRGDGEDGAESRAETSVEGVVELLGNGSAFLRVHGPEASDEDVYISAAQVRRCELVSGDRVSGRVRPPRRSERYPSLIRVDTINGAPADAVAAGTPYEELPAAYPTERFALGADDPTLKAIEWLTPVGRGSRVTIVGPPRAGKTEALRRLGAALGSQEDLAVTLVLAGVRPEEVAEWREGPVAPVAALTLAASAEAQAQAIERAAETTRRVAARGEHAVLLIDSLEAVHPPAARKALAAARNVVDGGSLTVIATADRPLGGETTVIALDLALTSTGRLPALDLVASGTLRPELLVGDAGAEAIAQARAAALE
ncbi:MAG: transcription termination factor Rho [Actinobacteria bacterium]|nr:MAG: transcription termination factor Rho [Actinomycetota bacterium]